MIGSVPGRHTVDKNKWGHLKLRKVLKEHGPDPAAVKSWPVIGQFSSIGSMGASKDQWLCREWLESLSATKSSTGFNINTRLQLVCKQLDTASANSVESDLRCTSRVYIDNVTLTSLKPCQYNNNYDCSE